MSKAFVILENPTVRWPVNVRVPVDGGFEEWRFTGVFRVLTEEEFDAWGVKPAIEAIDPSAPAPEPVEAPARPLSQVLADNADKFAQVLVGWDDVTDANGQSIPFTAGVFKAQVTGPNGRALSVGINTALAQIRYGVSPDQPGAALGNSAPPPAAG